MSEEKINGIGGQFGQFGKHGPILFAFAAQIGAALWWASGESEKVNSLMISAAENKTRIEAMQTFMSSKSDDLIMIKGELKHLGENVTAMTIDKKETVDHLKSIEESLFRVIGVINKNGIRR